MTDKDNEKTFRQKFSDGCASFGEFMFQKDPATGKVTVIGRSGKSWAKIGLFYLIFYGFLAAFFSSLLAVFLTTVNRPGEGGPKLTQFIKNQPGLTRLDQDKKYRLKINDEQIKKYIDYIKTYLDGFTQGENSGEKCKEENTDGIKEGQPPCIFDIEMLGPCSGRSINGSDADTSYGTNTTTLKPCIFVKVNKIYGWVPDKTGDSPFLKLNCDNGAKVYPDGFLLSAFPFRGQKDYKSPIVAVQIDVVRGVKKNVICELTGKNIETSSASAGYRAYGKIKLEDIGEV